MDHQIRQIAFVLVFSASLHGAESELYHRRNYQVHIKDLVKSSYFSMSFEEY